MRCPIHALAEATDRMASGHWDARAIPRGADDLRFFSHRLNLAAEHAERQLADLNHQRADLHAQNAALSSQLSSAASAPRFQALAAKQLGWVQATSDQTTYFTLPR